MEANKRPYKEIKNNCKVYDELIAFMKKTIPEYTDSDMIHKWDEYVGKEDRMYKLSKFIVGLQAGATIGTLALAVTLDPSFLGATIGVAPWTFYYYFMSRMYLKNAEGKKLEYLKYIKSLSECENRTKYPFEVGQEVDMTSATDFAKKLSGMSEEQLSSYLSVITEKDNEMGR